MPSPTPWKKWQAVNIHKNPRKQQQQQQQQQEQEQEQEQAQAQHCSNHLDKLTFDKINIPHSQIKPTIQWS